MNPMTIAREQEKNKDLIHVMMRSKQFKHVTIEGSTLTAHKGNDIYIPVYLRQRTVL
jgi:hypothetical protein